jgi:hypothetical protein
LGIFFEGKMSVMRKKKRYLKFWKESVLAHWKYIFLECQRKTAEHFSNVAHVTAVIRIGKFSNGGSEL